MKTASRPFVPAALGLVLLAAAGADGRHFAASGGDEDWALFARVELELLGGLWLLCGLAPRRARALALTASAGLLLGDVARALAGHPPRDVWGRVAAGPWWALCVDLAAVAALLWWRPTAASSPLIDTRPGWTAVAGVLAAGAGVAIDRSQVGCFPVVATARAGGPASAPGLDYLVYLPDGYHRSVRRWPLILYLHGAGDLGRGLERVRAGGLPRRVEARGRLPFVVVAPYCARGGWDVEALDALLSEALARYAVDADRVYLTGLSMGGYGAWALAAARPWRFAAVAPVCGGGDPAWADRLRGVPAWAFHGSEDAVVPHEESRRMVAALVQAGGEARLTTYRATGHDAWTAAYADPGLYAWFLAHRRRAGGPGGEVAAPPAPAP